MPISFSNFSFKPSTIIKTIGIIFAAILLLALAIRLLVVPLQSTFRLSGIPGMGQKPMVDSYEAMDSAMPMGMMAGMTASAPSLSIRNMLFRAPEEGSAGNAAEDFETTDYHATIETRDLSRTCETIVDLKAEKEIIFEQSNESDRYCSYTFKAAKDHVEHVLSVLEGLDPKDLTENTYTIQNTIEDFTSEMEILEKKRATIESTLESATQAYDQITGVASNAQDADALARIIESKLEMLERLTQERIEVNAQLERLTRAKAEQMDNVDYTTFSVSVYENKYLDGEQLKDSWKAAVKQFFNDTNQIVQDLTVNLVKLLLLAVQYFVYILLLVLFAKLVWSMTKGIWKK